MYKIFINKNLVILANSSENLPKQAFVVQEPNKHEVLTNIEYLEESKIDYPIVFIANDLELLKDIFFSFFKRIDAGGGLVRNEFDELLMIFRHGKWDLPKGKVEKNESIETGAIREVEEETGISNITLGEKISITYHVYTEKKKRKLKVSHWYKMTAPKQAVIPQLEEDITDVQWIKKQEIPSKLTNTFKNIALILEKHD